MATTKQTDTAPQAPNTLAEALAAAQLEITDPAKDAVNPHFRSRYADLATVLKTVRPVLARHGLAITQTTQVDEQGRLLLVTRLHWRDEELCGYYPIQPVKADPQGYGSALTYTRARACASRIRARASVASDGNAASAASYAAIAPCQSSAASARRAASSRAAPWSRPKAARPGPK